jgi:hypothetical protein
VLITYLDRDEGRDSVPNEGSQRDLAGSSSIHKELKKVKFLKFLGVMDDLAAEAWLDNMAIFFALCDYTSNMKLHMMIF